MQISHTGTHPSATGNIFVSAGVPISWDNRIQEAGIMFSVQLSNNNQLLILLENATIRNTVPSSLITTTEAAIPVITKEAIINQTFTTNVYIFWSRRYTII